VLFCSNSVVNLLGCKELKSARIECMFVQFGSKINVIYISEVIYELMFFFLSEMGYVCVLCVAGKFLIEC
jgi:hypothetical protein